MGKDKTPARIDPETTRAKAAEKHLKKKVVLPVFDTRQMTAYHHSVAFMVAKMANASQLQFLKEQVEKAQKEGLSFDQFAKNIEGQIPLSRARKALIFDTNLRSARAAGRWQAIEDTKELLPFLEYGPSDAGKPRDSHRHYYGVILPTDHDFWKTHFPPNGYGCRCKTYRLTRAQAQRKGGPSKDFEFNDDDVQESFRHNHTRRLEALADLAEKRFGTAFAQRLKQETLALYEAEAGKIADALEDFQVDTGYRPPLPTKGNIYEEARYYVVSNGRATGLEHSSAYSKDGKLLFTASGTEGKIQYDKKFLDLLEEHPGSVLYHNHPSGGTLSIDDFRFAADYQLKKIVAFGTTEEAEYVGWSFAKGYEIAESISGIRLHIREHFMSAYNAGVLAYEDGNILIGHVINQILKAQKMIGYEVIKPGKMTAEAIEKYQSLIEETVKSYKGSKK